MVNHARTLLMNRERFDGEIGEQFIPDTFVPVELTTPLLSARKQLFGSSPDRAMLNYRLAQVMPLLHETELEQYVLALDPRTTYTEAAYEDLFAASTFQPQVSAPGLYFQGESSPPDAYGRLFHEYNITATASGATVTVVQTTPKYLSTVSSPSYTGGISNEAIALGDSGYKFLLAEQSGNWRVTLYNRPTRDLGQITANLQVIGEPALIALFGFGTEKPYATFRNLFFDNATLPYRLGGLLLALIYRTEELRLG